LARKRVLVVFPTLWDSTQLEYCRPLWEDRFEVLFAGPNDEDCPWDFDILGFVDDAVRRYAGRIDGVLSSSDYPGVTVAGAIAEALGLPGTPPGVLLQISHKYYSRLLQRDVVPEAVPAFRAIDSARPEEQASKVNYPCFIKPVKGSFSMLARRIDSAEELIRFLACPEISEFTGGYLRLFDKLLQRYTDFGKSGAWFLAEELLQGVQVTVEGFCRGDTVRILGISDSVLHPEYGSFLRFSYPSSLPLQAQERMADIARRAACGFNLRETLFNIEMMYDPAADRISIIEINPRLCGQFADLYQKVDGINGYQVALALASGEPVPLNTQGPFRMAASFPLRVFGPVRVDRAPDEADRRAAEGLFPETRVWAECRPGEILGHGVNVEDGISRRYAVVNLGGDNLDEMIKRLQQVEGRLAFHLKAI